MLKHPEIDPIVFSIGPLSVQWYGVMYLLGFIAAYLLANKRKHRLGWSADDISDLIFYCAMGVIIGGRLGYVLLYKPGMYLSDPLQIFNIMAGGMSFHGGLMGVIFAITLFARKKQLAFLRVADFVAPLVPLGLFFGRIGNFINQELWGKPTDLSWAMVFTNDSEQLPRHPSMLYEAFLEGLVLFAILWLFSSKNRQTGQVAGLFLLGYGLFRFLVEFVRVPDDHLNYILFSWVTIGQIYCLPMLLAGLYLIFKKKPQ